LGSKKKLLESIVDVARSFPEAKSIIDLFSGTARVGHALKANGYQVFSNDHNAYAATLARCYVQANGEDWATQAQVLIDEFNALKGSPGYVTETFCVNSRYFQPKNGERIDAIREAISEKSLEPELEAILLVSLMEAADRVDSTTGVQMAYLKQWASRSNNDLALRLPLLLPQAKNGKSMAHQLEALDAAKSLHADLAYIDPPYNQHNYLGNYHIWESLVLWDKPEVYGIAQKRVDVKERRSIYNSKPAFKTAFRELLSSVRAKGMIISFSDEGYINREEMEELVAGLYDGNANVVTLSHDYKRYVGAQIGIHNPQGEKVGSVSHLKNKEFIFVVSGPDIKSVDLPIRSEPQVLF
jgi:adenine-specific DNA-methyltransferase